MAERKTTKQFIRQSKKIHGNKYDYSLVQYKNAYTKVKIICRHHGIFIQDPHEHLKGCGCRICAFYDKRHILPKLTRDEFIERANKIHSNKYNYDKVIFSVPSKNVIITCPVHGDFSQSYHSHLGKRGCPKCSSSVGEMFIMQYLEENKIEYVKQKIFKDKPPYNKLRFDFYLPFLNTIVEFNGLQHYKSISFFGGNKNLARQQNSDTRKELFAKTYNINLIILSYLNYDAIEAILNHNLFKQPTAR